MKGADGMLNGIWMAMIVLAFIGAVCTGRWTALSRCCGGWRKAGGGDGAFAARRDVPLDGHHAYCGGGGAYKRAFQNSVAGHQEIGFRITEKMKPCAKKYRMNIAANMLGMGNAATPFGLSAMDEMQKLQTGDTPTQEMILFVVMNTASFQLIPSAAVTLRASYGSADPYDVLRHIWLVSFGGLLVCVLMCRVFQKLWRA